MREKKFYVLLTLLLVLSFVVTGCGKKATPTPAVSGTELRHDSEGVVFKDYDAGYTIRIPADWLAFRPSEDDVQKIVQEAGQTIPGVDAGAMERAALNVSKNVTLMALYLKSGPDLVTNVHVTDYPVRKRYSMREVIPQEEEALRKGIPGIVIESAGVKQNKNGVEIAEVVVRFPTNTQGESLGITEMLWTFQPNRHSVVRVVFGTPSHKAKTMRPVADDIMDGIALMQQ